MACFLLQKLALIKNSIVVVLLYLVMVQLLDELKAGPQGLFFMEMCGIFVGFRALKLFPHKRRRTVCTEMLTSTSTFFILIAVLKTSCTSL